MADRHLEAAAKVLTTEAIAKGPYDGWRRETTQAIVTAYLDSLLGELPERAVEAMIAQTKLPPHAASVKRPAFEKQLQAALGSLRDSLVSGRGEETADG